MLRADFRYLHIEIFAPTNAQIVEGIFARPDPSPAIGTAGSLGDGAIVDPPPVTTLFGSLDLDVYHTFDGTEGHLSAGYTGDLLLCSAKDGSYAAHARMELSTDGVLAADECAVLVNSRERMTYDLVTDTFYYGTKAINFPRDAEFQITFLYGGGFTYYDADHFEIRSASGVTSAVTIQTVPEPATIWMLATAAFITQRRPSRRR